MPKSRSNSARDWIPATAWFVATTAAGGLWYFVATKDWPSLVVTASITVVLALMAATLQGWLSSGAPAAARGDAKYLLRLVWNYPRLGAEEKSWAVKESAVLLGEMATAREHPGLGISIVTTELGLLAFGSAAESRIAGVATWALQHCEREPPFRMTANVRDPIGFATIEVKPDLRHTMAFGIVLIRANRDLARAAGYLALALDAQQDDGGWMAADPTGDRAVFATLYGAELVCLGAGNPVLRPDLRRRLPRARRRALEWLILNRLDNGLWSTGVFRDEAWDCAVATAWVLHRMIQPPRSLSSEWKGVVDRAVLQLVSLCEDRITWLGTSAALRFRIEARVAGAVRRVLSSHALLTCAEEPARRYLGAWQLGVRSQLEELNPSEVDVGTAAFAAWGLADADELRRLGGLVAAEEDS